MIKKFFIYCKSDGVFNALRFLFGTITGIFYRYSSTLFYRRVGDDLIYEYPADVDFKEVSLEELTEIDFPRLKTKAYKSWMNNGSRLVIGFKNSQPICYGWIHSHQYHFYQDYYFMMEDNEYWLGPSFVHFNHRGHGFQKGLLKSRLDLVSSIPSPVFYTSVSSRNIPSIKSIEKMGFESIGSLECHVLFGKNIKCKIVGDEDFKGKISNEVISLHS